MLRSHGVRRRNRAARSEATVRYPLIYEINTWVWLSELSRRAGAPIDLASVPESEWDAVAALGFDAVWLMGVWERSPAGISIALAEREPDRELPPCAARLPDHGRGRLAVLHPRLRGRLPRSAGRRGSRPRGRHWPSAASRLLLDFVPNHVAPDHPWTQAHPEYFVRGSAEDLARDPASFLRVSGGVLANGRDPYFPAWPDVVQLNAFSPALRAAAIGDADVDCGAVRRRPLRHGDADDERHVRAHLGRARRAKARRRVLDGRDPRREERAPRLPVHRRGLLGPRVGAAAAGLRLLLRQAALRPPRARRQPRPYAGT